MRRITVYFLCFLFGSISYPLIEILFRGYTHISMSILGGICLCAVYFVHESLGKRNLLLKALCSAVLITQLEFICGMIVNRAMDLAVWDYSDRPLNLAGQICPLFTFFWFLLSLISLWFFLSFEKERKQRKLPSK